MTYIVDIIIVAIFALVIFTSAKKGFFRSFIDFAGSFIAVAVAKLFSQSVAKTVFDSFVASGAERALANNLGDMGTTGYTEQVENILASLPSGLNGILQIMGIDSDVLIEKVSQADLNGGNLVESLMNSVVVPLGTAVVQFVLFVVSAIAIIFIIKVLSKLIDGLVKKLPVIKGFNKTLGAVFGILRGFIIVIIVSMLISVVVSFISNEALITSVESSIIINAVRGTVTALIGMNI